MKDRWDENGRVGSSQAPNHLHSVTEKQLSVWQEMSLKWSWSGGSHSPTPIRDVSHFCCSQIQEENKANSSPHHGDVLKHIPFEIETDFIFIYFFLLGGFYLKKRSDGTPQTHYTVVRAADCWRSHPVCINRSRGCCKLSGPSISDGTLGAPAAEHTASE